MARTKKVPNEIKKRLRRREQRRKEAIRSKRVYFLIVCEGSKTEPLYFEAFKKDLPKGVLESISIEIEGEGKNTLSLIEEVLKIRESREKLTGRAYDQSWAVFDKDSFPPEHFNNAINKAAHSNPPISTAWSNEAFELWYLLHFQFFQNGMNRDQYKDIIERELSERMGQEFKYNKNDPQMYEYLKEYGSIDQAISWAESLEKVFEGRLDYAEHNPCTKVYHLVRELINLKDQ